MSDEEKKIRRKLVANLRHIEARFERLCRMMELVLSAPNMLPNERAWKEQQLLSFRQAKESAHQALEIALAAERQQEEEGRP